MKKLLSVVLGFAVAGVFPAAELFAGDSYSLAPRVENSSRSYLLSRNTGPTTHVFDGVAESIGENRYGPVGGTLDVEEDSFSVAPGIERHVVEVTALDVAGYPTPWVNYQWAGIGLIHWRLDVGSTFGGTDPIDFDSPIEVVDSGYSVFDRRGNWLGDYELYADTSTATSLSGVAIHSIGGQDIAGVDVATIQMWWDIRQPEAAPPPTVVGFICRTPGFWGTHAADPKRGDVSIVEDILNWGGPLSVCGLELNTSYVDYTASTPSNSTTEAMCVSPKSASELQLARQLTALSLNCRVSGGELDPEEGETLCTGTLANELYAACDAACQGDSSGPTVQECIYMVDCINNGNDLDPETGMCMEVPACADGSECNDAGYCADGSMCMETCHTRELCDESDDSLFCYDPPGPASSPRDCNAAIKNDIYVMDAMAGFETD